ncbi:hypothetical protein ACJZ2D_007816 [Fusarium nematophilum]
MSFTLKRLLPLDPALDDPVGSLVHTRLVANNNFSRHIDVEFSTIRHCVANSKTSVCLQQTRGRWLGYVAALLPHLPAPRLTARHEHFAVLDYKSPSRLFPS